jgi:excisionase family DNA binding protein
MLKPDQHPQEEITIKISFSGGLESLFPKLSNVLEMMQNGLSTAAVQEQDEIMTPDELAELFKIPKSKIYQMTMKSGPGSIPRFKVGRDLRFKRSEVIPWFESQAE